MFTSFCFLSLEFGPLLTEDQADISSQLSEDLIVLHKPCKVTEAKSRDEFVHA